MAAPAIVLVRPQLGENIGACARAMLNCGLTDLRIVAPRDGWPSESAWAASSGAIALLENARLCQTIPEAIADCDVVYASGAPLRPINLPVDTAEQAVARVHTAERPAILFGPERTGLENDDIAYAARMLTIPLNPDFNSLNLAQAVLLVSYLWYQGRPEMVTAWPQDHRLHKTKPATQDQVNGLIEHLTTELDNAHFFTSPNKRPSMLRNMRASFARMEMTEQDVLTFRGIIRTLVLGHRSERQKLKAELEARRAASGEGF